MKYILKGNSSIHVIGTVNQEDKYIMETLNTLNFISKAKQIDIQPKMNFQTKNENVKEKQLTTLLEKVQYLEADRKGLRAEADSLRVKFEIEKSRFTERLREKEAMILKLKEQVSELEKSRAEDLDKTVLVSSKRPVERPKPVSGKARMVQHSFNYLHPKLKKERKRYPKLNSIIYNSQEKEKLKFLDSFNKSIDFGKKNKSSIIKGTKYVKTVPSPDQKKKSRILNKSARRKQNNLFSEKRKKMSMDLKCSKKESEASQAVVKFIKKINTNIKLNSGRKSGRNLAKPKDFLFKSKPIFKNNNLKTSKIVNKCKEKKMKVKKTKNKALDFEKILNNFSLYSKIHEPLAPMNDISLSTINHSGMKNLKFLNKKVSDKSCMTEFDFSKKTFSIQIATVLSYASLKNPLNETKIASHKHCSFIYSNNKSRVDNNTTKKNISCLDLNQTKDRKQSRRGSVEGNNKSTKNEDSMNSMSKLEATSPRQFQSMVRKMYKKIKFIEKKNGNLERQLRNRNKDYLYALKEIEIIKFKIN